MCASGAIGASCGAWATTACTRADPSRDLRRRDARRHGAQRERPAAPTSPRSISSQVHGAERARRAWRAPRTRRQTSRCSSLRPVSTRMRPPRSALLNSCVRCFGSRATSSSPTRVREARDVVVVRLAVERHDDVKALRAGRLHPARQAELASRSRKHEASPQRSRRLVVVGGIEVEDADVGLS